jgi:hypothetical protein
MINGELLVLYNNCYVPCTLFVLMNYLFDNINYVNKPLLFEIVYGAALKIKSCMLRPFILSTVKLAKCSL